MSWANLYERSPEQAQGFFNLSLQTKLMPVEFPTEQ
jgi:hypothetical protein